MSNPHYNKHDAEQFCRLCQRKAGGPDDRCIAFVPTGAARCSCSCRQQRCRSPRTLKRSQSLHFWDYDNSWVDLVCCSEQLCMSIDALQPTLLFYFFPLWLCFSCVRNVVCSRLLRRSHSPPTPELRQLLATIGSYSSD